MHLLFTIHIISYWYYLVNKKIYQIDILFLYVLFEMIYFLVDEFLYIMI